MNHFPASPSSSDEELASLYALDALTPAETETVEKRMTQDEAFRTLVHQTERTHEQALFATAEFQAPPDIFANIRASIREETPKPKAVPFPRLIWGGLAAAAALALTVGLFLGRESLPSQATEETQQQVALASEVESLRHLVEELRDKQLTPAGTPLPTGDGARLLLAQMHAPTEERPELPASRQLEQRQLQLTVLADSVWQILEFDRQAAGLAQRDPAAHRPPLGYVMLDVDSRFGYLAVDNFPRVPEGGAYHVWVEQSGQTEPLFAGVLPPLTEGQGLLYFDLSRIPTLQGVENVQRLYITSESDLRQANPQGDVILEGI